MHFTMQGKRCLVSVFVVLLASDGTLDDVVNGEGKAGDGTSDDNDDAAVGGILDTLRLRTQL